MVQRGAPYTSYNNRKHSEKNEICILLISLKKIKKNTNIILNFQFSCKMQQWHQVLSKEVVLNPISFQNWINIFQQI